MSGPTLHKPERVLDDAPSGTRKPIRGWLLGLFLLSVALRVAYVAPRWEMVPQWNVDAIGYQQLALNLRAGHGFSLNTEAPFRPDAIRTPGYPLLIAALYAVGGIQPHLVILAQCVLDALTAVMVGWLAWRLTQRRFALVVAGLCYATETVAWRYIAELYVEVVQGCALMLLCACLIGNAFLTRHRTLHAALLGVIAGALVLIKPNLLPLPLFLAVYLWMQARRWQSAATAILASALVLLPWAIRNQSVFGRFTVSTVFENNVLVVSAPATLVEVNHEDTLPWTPQWMTHFNAVVDRAMQAEPALLTIPEAQMTDRQRGEASAALARAAQHILREHPIEFIVGHLKGIARGLHPQEHQFWFEAIAGKSWDTAVPKGMLGTMLSGELDHVSRLAVVIWAYFTVRQILGLGLAIAGMIYLWRSQLRSQRRSQRRFLFWGLTLTLYAVALPGPILYERFVLPVMPILCVFVGVGASYARRVLHRRGSPHPTNTRRPGPYAVTVMSRSRAKLISHATIKSSTSNNIHQHRQRSTAFKYIYLIKRATVATKEPYT